MTITDSIALILSVFLLLKGAFRGFLGSLLGPISLILTTIVSAVYFLLTKDIRISLCIGLFGPFIFGWILRTCLHSIMSNPQGKISLISRIWGAFITWTWGTIILVITILLLSMLPAINHPLEFIYKDIHNSTLYKLIKPLDSFAVEPSGKAENLESLSQDKRIQDILNDPKIIEDIKNKNYSQLLSNPKITTIVQDPALMKKMMSVYRQMMEEKLKSQ